MLRTSATKYDTHSHAGVHLRAAIARVISAERQVAIAARFDRFQQLWDGHDLLGNAHFWATLDADSIRPYLPNLPVLLAIASFQGRDYQLRHPPELPLSGAPVAVDSGAFMWFQRYTNYHFSAAQ